MKVSDMPIAEEMKNKVAQRVSMLSSMMAGSALVSPVEYLEIPVILVMHRSNDDLLSDHNHLMRTRKHSIRFELNGHVFILTRKLAISVVREEIKVRGMKSNA